MNKRGFFKIIILVAIIIAIGIFWFFNQNEGPKEICPGEGCVKVQTTCCPCNMGGEEKCVQESEASQYTEMLENCPATQICAAVYNCQIESCNEKEEA